MSKVLTFNRVNRPFLTGLSLSVTLGLGTPLLCLILSLLIIKLNQGNAIVFALALMLLILGMMGGVFWAIRVWIVCSTKIVVSDAFLEIHSLFSRRQIPWDDITTVGQIELASGRSSRCYDGNDDYYIKVKNSDRNIIIGRSNCKNIEEGFTMIRQKATHTHGDNTVIVKDYYIPFASFLA